MMSAKFVHVKKDNKIYLIKRLTYEYHCAVRSPYFMNVCTHPCVLEWLARVGKVGSTAPINFRPMGIYETNQRAHFNSSCVDRIILAGVNILLTASTIPWGMFVVFLRLQITNKFTKLCLFCLSNKPQHLFESPPVGQPRSTHFRLTGNYLTRILCTHPSDVDQSHLSSGVFI